MAHHLTWPGKYFFYPIGNTSAMSLTRDIAPEEDVNLLLLGCGDPRHVLYTLYNEPLDSHRKLDFTCCDLDPAILARNIILLTMVVDNYSPQTVWNIFFHMKIDQSTHESLRDHCEKLLELSMSMGSWRASPYSACIKFCTEHTLIEMRRHWSLYASMHSLPEPRLKQISDAFQKMAKNANEKRNLNSLRSRGPLFLVGNGVISMTEQFENYWKTGTTFTTLHRNSLATLINPTFAYCLVGEGCCVHYGTDPLTPFHLAEAIAMGTESLEIADLLKVAQKQFVNWCNAYRILVSSKNRVLLRFIVGDAIAVSRAFRYFTETGKVKTNVTCAHWKASRIELDREEYLSQHAPSTFNVVETSNLDDHIGLLNVLISTSLVLATNGVLYSESLLYRTSNDATKDFNERLYADIALIGLLLQLCPVDYMSSFNARSNTVELLIEKGLRKMGKSASQFHQVTTWKAPTSGDVRASSVDVLPDFDPIQLGTVLWDIYHRLFELDDAKTFFERLPWGKRNMMESIMKSSVLHYTRETFVFFLKVVRDRLRIDPKQWFTVMDRFFHIQIDIADKIMPMDTVNSQELYGLLHAHGLYTVEVYRDPKPYLVKKIGRFARWSIIPPVVQIVLIVPRNKLDVLVWPDPKDPTVPDAMTFPLQCFVRGMRMANTFSAVDVAFGRVSRIGTSELTQPTIAFEEDVEGWEGHAPLVASFLMPTQLLMFHEPQYLLSVHLAVHDTPGRTMSPTMQKLSSDCSIFSAGFLDEEFVHVLPPNVAVGSKSRASEYTQKQSSSLTGNIGQAGNAVVELNEDGAGVSSLTTRIDIESEDVKRIFAGGEIPQILQTSPCIMQLELGKYKQDVVFPFPISGGGNRLRLARKSQWIEVIVPLYAPFQPDAIKFNPFPVVGSSPALTSWNIHRVNLDRSPIIARNNSLDEWFDLHIGSMMSARERSLREKGKKDIRMSLKNSLQSLFLNFSGVRNKNSPRVFGLVDVTSNNCDTILFAKELKFDLASHTVICDGYVLPLTNDIKESNAFPYLVHESGMKHILVAEGEMIAWKHLLPAGVERCRKWRHNSNCEYKATGRIPISEKIEENPLCSCGCGKDVDGMKTEELWRPFAPYCWHIALSPLFAVSYLERVLGSFQRCHRCLARGNPKLQACGKCRKTRYCSRECQKADWKKHKETCKA